MAGPLDPRLVRRAAGMRRLLVLAVVLGVATAAAVVVQAVLLARILAAVVVSGAVLADVTASVVVLGLVIVLRAGLAWAEEELARRSALAVTTSLRGEVLVHAGRLGPRWRSGRHGGSLATLVTTGIDALHDYFARYVPQLVLAAMVPVGTVVVLFVADPISGLIAALTVPLVPVFMAMVGWYTDRATRRKWRTLARLGGHFTDVLAGLPTLKVFGRARAQADAVRAVTERHRRSTMGTLRIAFLSSLVLELLSTLSVALIAVTVGLRMVSGGIDLATGLVVLILAPEVYLPLRRLGTQFHAAADGAAAVGEVLAVLDTPVPRTGTRTDIGEGAPGFRLRGVTVGTGRGRVGPWDLDLPAGRLTVVTGDSGVGKTTLLQVLSGVLPADGGTVLVTGGRADVPVADLAPELRRTRFSFCGQRPVLSAGSISDNLGGVGIPVSEVRRALVAVRATGFVDDLPDGVDTVLGDGGAGLSQGQRQRLCLARTLLHAPAGGVVLLDEPTAALDPGTEDAVLDGLLDALASRTVVLVSHRSAPVRRADHLVHLTAPDPGGPTARREALAVTPW
ncbi:thiol reductant ABC exporter subunit CydD [Nakamurella sp. YIM 132087]|uniref:Thiol reductant ABC exporter subunit CydD n=1 Tax=Nakamurella alba TaxID=2665158 RepID=A0A7K1FQW2_9ACTN|nr:thiol reductant ABC exporter subunit CydD [Nakamurella alba]MTD16460.1 thiol reductant ABC exporter subunit CydD [Nakamurella alba]